MTRVNAFKFLIIGFNSVIMLKNVFMFYLTTMGLLETTAYPTQYSPRLIINTVVQVVYMRLANYDEEQTTVKPKPLCSPPTH
jgi:hypothetical protein